MIGTKIIGAFLTLSTMFGGFGGQEATSSRTTVSTANVADSIIMSVEISQGDNLEEYVRDYFAEDPLLAEIAMCESTMTHVTASGSVIRGKVNSKDVGLMQINENYHLERATALGFDIHTLEGNMAYARYLFGKEGSQPWKSSSKCWIKTDAYKEFALTQ